MGSCFAEVRSEDIRMESAGVVTSDFVCPATAAVSVWLTSGFLGLELQANNNADNANKTVINEYLFIVINDCVNVYFCL